jgi:signal transduction histidine kinase
VKQGPRIAVLAGTDSRLPGLLEAAPRTGEVQVYRDLYADAAALRAFAPRVLFLSEGPDLPQELGAARVLAALIPGLDVVLVCDAETATELAPFAADAGTWLLRRPYTEAGLEDLLREVLADPTATGPESYVDFARGICDEINNPLMFALGHLQLLRTRLDKTTQPTAFTQIDAVRRGLQRIEETMEKVRCMSRATQGDRLREEFTVGTLLAHLAERQAAAGLAIQVDCREDLQLARLRGDETLLAAALFYLCQVGAEIGTDGTPLRLSVHASPEGAAADFVFELRVNEVRLESWELPDAFEPYHLNGILRGTSLGLNLFLVRLVARAHSGEATVQREGERTVRFALQIRAKD